MKHNPYLIEGPAQISFSGGRSSAMMLCKIVEAHGGALPADVVVSFANTGKEDEATLVFVQAVAEHLRVSVNWIEFRDIDAPQKDRWAKVDFATASRKGEPFVALLHKNKYLPNPMARTCTQHLKIKPMEGYMRHLGFKDYASVAGIRADEPRRVANMRARTDVDFVLPLADAGVSRGDVVAFWKAMPFDLGLPSVGGETIGGNCDLCFLKGTQKLLHIIRDDPTKADWWIAQETYAINNYTTKTSGSNWSFRIDRQNYATLKLMATQPMLWDEPTEDAMPCECTD